MSNVNIVVFTSYYEHPYLMTYNAFNHKVIRPPYQAGVMSAYHS
jgi:hypothetical protein